MKVKVSYTMSQDWKRKQLIATGELVEMDREAELDLVQLTPDQREDVLDVGGNQGRGGSITLGSFRDGGYGGSPSFDTIYYDAELLLPEVLEVIHTMRLSCATAREHIKARRAAEQAESLAVWERRHATEAEARAARDAKEAEEAARKQAQADQIAAWVAKYGTENQQERHAAGLLPEQEVLQVIEAAAFAPLSGEQLYQKLRCADIVCTANHYETRNHFHSEVASEATAEQWTALKRIKAAMPDAEIELRVHIGECQIRDCGSKAYRYGIEITLTVGAFTFSREYAAAD